MANFVKTSAGYAEVARAADENSGFTTAPTLQALTRLYPPKTNVGREATVGLVGGPFTNYVCTPTAWVVASAGSGGGSTVTVIDSLMSTSTTAALSAKQGMVLKGLIDDLPDPVASAGLVSIAFSASLPYTIPEATFGTVTPTGNVTITPNATGAEQFNSVIGVFAPSAFDVTLGAGYVPLQSDPGYDRTKRCTFASYFDGAQFLYQFVY